MQILLVLLLTVWFDGRPLECLVDTGSYGTLLTERAAAQVRHALVDPQDGYTVQDASGIVLPARSYTARHVGTAHLGWERGQVLVVPDGGGLHERPCILGMNFLSRQPLLFDWAAGEVYPAPVPLDPAAR